MKTLIKMICIKSLIVILACNLAQADNVKDKFFGVHEDLLGNTDSNARAEDIALLVERIEELGVGSIRMPIRWKKITDGTECNTFAQDVTPVLNTENMEEYRAIIDAIPQNVDILVYLDSPSDICKDLYLVNPVAFSRRFGEYVELVVDNFKDRVRYFEIWNEENSNHFFLEPPYANGWSAWDYVNHILVPGYAAVKSSDSTARVVMGGLSYDGITGHGPLKDYFDQDWFVISDFLYPVYSAMISLTNAVENCPNGRCFDILGVHPYWYSNRFSTTNNYFDPFHQVYGAGRTNYVMQNWNDHNSEIWWTEMGESNDPKEFLGNPHRQADKLTEIMNRAQSYRPGGSNQNKLGRVFWFQLREPIKEKKLSPIGFGLMDVDSSRRPAFYSYKDRIFDLGSPVSIIDDFEIQKADSGIFSDVIWQTSCSDSPINCDHRFWGEPTEAQNSSVLFSTNSVSSEKTAISVKKAIPFQDGQTLSLFGRLNSFGFDGAPSDVVTTVISIGSMATINPTALGQDLRNGIHISFRRLDEVTIAVDMQSVNNADQVQAHFLRILHALIFLGYFP